MTTSNASAGQPPLAIRLDAVSKRYRLYQKPMYRLLDFFGACPQDAAHFTEHAALDSVDVSIARGEKVAIIGRNGAGKSTLLKIITGIVRPTTGSVTVNGAVSNLLQIGSGFHPDFTGRQNVFASLAHQGITGQAAEQAFDEIVDFAEIEEYIDQPMKTYSTGMCSRLMFSSSVVMQPEILIVDEILGVGDAYFAQKSYERMREMCERQDATLLLVTHDVYSAAKMCNRVLWLDRGRLLMDGDGPRVVKAYEDSIRQQEEQRLRLRKQRQLGTGTDALIIEIHSRDNEPQPSPLYLSRVAVARDGESVSLPLDATAFDPQLAAHLQREGGCWGDVVDWQGRPARALLNYGSPFHKVSGVAALQNGHGGPLSIEIDYWTERPGRYVVCGFSGSRVVPLGELDASAGGWTTFTATESPAEATADPGFEVSHSGRQGTGAVAITSVKVLDHHDADAHILEHGRSCAIELDYSVRDPNMHESAQLLFAFHRDGVLDIARIITRDLVLDASRPRGHVRAVIPSLMLGTGTYTLTVMVAREGYYDETQTLFYSINPGVHALLARILEVNVVGGGLVAAGTGVVCEAEWTF